MKNYIMLKNNGIEKSIEFSCMRRFSNKISGIILHFNINKIILLIFILTSFGSVTGQNTPASNPPPIPQRGMPTNQNAAPIGDGTFYLAGFMLAYIAIKIRQAKKNKACQSTHM